MTKILVYVQIDNDFSVDLISYAKEISNGAEITGAVVLPVDIEFDFSNLNKFGLEKLYILRSKNPIYDKRANPFLLIELIKKINPEIFILNSTTEGREIAPIVASTLETGLTADCTKLEITDNKLLSTRPTFGGKLMASIFSKKNPQMATVRINTFKKKIFESIKPLRIEEVYFDTGRDFRTEILEFLPENSNEFLNLQNSKIILTGGMGLKNKKNFDKLFILAGLLGAKAAGTRKAVDKGFISREFQIGQTGKTVSPEIYIGFGVSGAVHHIAGMENSKKIIAINTDPNAPIFKTADIGIIEDAAFVLDFLIENCKHGVTY